MQVEWIEQSRWNPMPIEDDNAALVRDAVLIFGGLNFCESCKRWASTEAPIFTDEAYGALAVKMNEQGWTATPGLDVFLSRMFAQRNLEFDS